VKPPYPWAAFALYGVTLCASSLGCHGDFQFATKFAPDFQPAHHTLSVFGVYKDGQMSSDAWGGLRPRIERSLGGGAQCEAGYSSIALTNPPLSAAIDDYAREGGPSEDLLAQLGPAARGDLIVVFTTAGKLRVPTKTSVQDATRPAGGMGGRGFASIDSKPKGGEEGVVLQLSALFFSVAQGRSVALVDLWYSGESIDEALSAFNAKLSQSMPGATCGGWNWSAKVDPERIRELAR
jgi:hypothetical protein